MDKPKKKVGVDKPAGKGQGGPGWLVFFYSVPSRPVSGRMQVWRRLKSLGALQLKDAVYVLPDTEANLESLRWLVSEVSSKGGEAAIIHALQIEPLTAREIVALFHRSREEDYQALDKVLSTLERRVQALGKGGRGPEPGALRAEFGKLKVSLDEALRADHFGSPLGRALGRRFEVLESQLGQLRTEAGKPRMDSIQQRRATDYRARAWVTRTAPFVDRMASAWLIKTYIDPEARFGFVGEGQSAPPGAVTFDMTGAEFTHVGELCTFEVLVKGFGLKGRALQKIAHLVHELDLKDGRYAVAEALGVEEILQGIRKSAQSDQDMLERGMKVFEMLYASKG